jgi:hypothetical protein
MEVEGRVEAVSYKNKGIKVNGRWYNVPEDMLKQIQKNHRVKLFIDDFGNVLEVEVLGYEEQIDKDLKIEALRASIEILKLNFQFGHPYDLVPASELKNFEKQVDTSLKLLEKTYKRVLKLIK